MSACGAVCVGGWTCDYPKGHEDDSSRHYYDRFYHHHALPVEGIFVRAIEWKVDNAPPEPPR